MRLSYAHEALLQGKRVITTGEGVPNLSQPNARAAPSAG